MTFPAIEPEKWPKDNQSKDTWPSDNQGETNEPTWANGLNKDDIIPLEGEGRWPNNGESNSFPGDAANQALMMEALAELQPEIEAAGAQNTAANPDEAKWPLATKSDVASFPTTEHTPNSDPAGSWTHDLMNNAFAELKPEIDAWTKSKGLDTLKQLQTLPSLEEVLNEFGPMLPEALFLGVASDGLPVLLNLHDPVPGPLLIAGDAGTGKTTLLQTIAEAAAMMHQSEQLQFGVLTSNPDEWKKLKDAHNNVGIFPMYHQSSEDFILSLASWAHGNKSSGQSIVLLIDDLEQVAKMDYEAQQNLRWLLLRGPARRVWPIITVNADRYGKTLSWIPNFRTRIYGPIKNEKTARALGAGEEACLDSLNIGTQFTMSEGNHWLRFWKPS